MKQKWPQPIVLTKKLKDMLEPKVDEKYYLKADRIEAISKWNAQQDPFHNMFKAHESGIVSTITTREADEQSGMKLIMGDNLDKTHYMKNGELSKFNAENVLVGENGIFTTLRTHGTDAKVLVKNVFESGHHGGIVHDPNEVAPTFKENHSNGLFIQEATKKGYAEAKAGDGVYIQNMKNKRGTVQKDKIQTIKTGQDIGVVTPELRIRKITPREALRLMGLDDKRIDLIQDSELVSHNKQYFIAGNSIVVNVLEAIFKGIDFKHDINMLELFSGYGSQSIAMENNGHGVTGNISEWFVDAIIANALLHHNDDFWKMFGRLSEKGYPKEKLLEMLKPWTLSTDSKKPNDLKRLTIERLVAIYCANVVTNNLGSVLDIKGDTLDQYDLMTYSFPCQDLSLAGKRKGMSKEDNTRSGLLWEVERILLEAKKVNKLPKVLLMENVPQIHSKDNMEDFNKWIGALMDMGYKNTWRDLNAKNFGVPQNRNRTFMVSILDGEVQDEKGVQLSLDLF